MGNPIAIQLLSGAAPTWDALYKFAKITASANVAITISGAGTPDGGVLHFKQGGAGGFSLTINGTTITVNATGTTRVDWAYDGEDYTYHTNVQGGASGEATIIPAAPTGGTVDDTANTFTFTLNPSYAASEHEYSLNGAGYVACSSNVISVGDVAVAIGDLLVRVKAGTNRNASATLANATAFTVSGGGSVSDADAQAFITVVEGNVALSAGQKTALDNLYLGLKGANSQSANLYTKIDFWPFVGGTEYAHSINGKTPSVLDHRLVFYNTVAGDHTAQGWLPNGTNAYASTLYQGNGIGALTSRGLAYYSRTANTDTGRIDMGYYDAANEATALCCYDSDIAYGYAATLYPNSITGANTNSQGFYVLSRTASDAVAIYRNGTSIGTSTAAAVGTGSLQFVYLGANHSSSGVANHSNRQCAFAAVLTSGLTATEVAALWEVVQAYQTALGRAVA
jgi:hypothetical protein